MTDRLEPELSEIPAGEFTMGDIWGDGDPDEQPTHALRVDSFLLGTYTVTNSQFLLFLNDIKENRDRDGDVFVDIRNTKNPITAERGRFSCRPGYENYPVTYVSWLGAVAYCEWLSYRTGISFRLPTEIEWQYAGMGPDRLKWGHGDSFQREDYISSRQAPGPVDYGKPSAWGLFNMTGNVFEWCADEYRFSFTGEGEENTLRQNRVIKGGAFILNDSANFRNAKRFSCYQKSCLFSIGFRVAAAIN